MVGCPNLYFSSNGTQDRYQSVKTVIKASGTDSGQSTVSNTMDKIGTLPFISRSGDTLLCIIIVS